MAFQRVAFFCTGNKELFICIHKAIENGKVITYGWVPVVHM